MGRVDSRGPARPFRLLDPDVVWDISHLDDWPEPTYHGFEGVERFLNEWRDVGDVYRSTSLGSMRRAPSAR